MRCRLVVLVPAIVSVGCGPAILGKAAGAGVAAVVEAAVPSKTSPKSLTAGWPDPSRRVFEFMEKKYGNPAERSATMAVWQNVGPWKRVIVRSEAIPHTFPTPHVDVIEHVINYTVPPDMVDDLAEYNGSVIVDQTRGELSARCDSEAANILALNLAHEIITGKRTVADARETHAAQMKAMMAGQPAPLTERLMATPQPAPSNNQAKPVI